MKIFLLFTSACSILCFVGGFSSPRSLELSGGRSKELSRFMSGSKNEERTSMFSREVQEEAKAALESVGWARPLDDGEMTSDDPFVKQIDASIKADFGVGLDDLLNPAKVVNLERDLYNLRSELAAITESGISEVAWRSTEECDGGGGGEDADAIREKISKKEQDLALERRSIFRDWLKNVFLGQAIISFALSYVMATNPESIFGGFSWYYSYNMDVSISVLGYWWWWLFVIPSLRSRRPKGQEKEALDIAFLGTPLISILAPVVTKDTGIIWAANFVVVVGSYAFVYLFGDKIDDDRGLESRQPEWIKFVYKSLDFGSGRERGARK